MINKADIMALAGILYGVANILLCLSPIAYIMGGPYSGVISLSYYSLYFFSQMPMHLENLDSIRILTFLLYISSFLLIFYSILILYGKLKREYLYGFYGALLAQFISIALMEVLRKRILLEIASFVGSHVFTSSAGRIDLGTTVANYTFLGDIYIKGTYLYIWITLLAFLLALNYLLLYEIEKRRTYQLET